LNYHREGKNTAKTDNFPKCRRGEQEREKHGVSEEDKTPEEREIESVLGGDAVSD